MDVEKPVDVYTDTDSDDTEPVPESEGKEVSQDTTPGETVGSLQVVEQLEYVNTRLDMVTNITIVIMIGLGVVAGILLNRIFSSYFGT